MNAALVRRYSERQTTEAWKCPTCIPPHALAAVGNCEMGIDWDEWEPVNWPAFALRRATGWTPPA